MKKMQFLLIMAIIVSTITTTKVTAQLFASNSGENKYAASPFNSEENIAGYKSAEKLNKAGYRAFKNFNHQFEDEPGVKWIAEERVISARFKRDDITTTVVYDKKGRWLRNMLVYDENKMPKDVRQLIRRNYKSYQITSVQEFKEGDIQFYIVHLEDEKGYKLITVYNGETNVYKEYSKPGK